MTNFVDSPMRGLSLSEEWMGVRKVEEWEEEREMKLGLVCKNKRLILKKLN